MYQGEMKQWVLGGINRIIMEFKSVKFIRFSS